MTKSSASRSRTAGASLFNSARFHKFSMAMIFEESCARARKGVISHREATTSVRFIEAPESLSRSKYIGRESRSGPRNESSNGEYVGGSTERARKPLLDFGWSRRPPTTAVEMRETYFFFFGARVR